MIERAPSYDVFPISGSSGFFDPTWITINRISQKKKGRGVNNKQLDLNL